MECECGHSDFVHVEGTGECIVVIDATGELGFPPVFCGCEKFQAAEGTQAGDSESSNDGSTPSGLTRSA